MKKLSIIAFAALLVVAFTAPAWAVDHVFGGYWRTRFYLQDEFDSTDNDVGRTVTYDAAGVPTYESNNADWSGIDTRTRLYYTAKFSDNLKFVNKFEMDAVWGGPKEGYGDIGADGKDLEIKNSYVDFNLGAHRFTVGVQGFELAKGFLFSDDAAGMKLIFKAGEGIYLPLIWIRAYEGGMGEAFDGSDWYDLNEGDTDALVFYPSLYFGKDMKLMPHVAWLYSERYGDYFRAASADWGELSLFSLGLEWDHTVGAFNYGLTGIYETGSVEATPGGEDIDISAYLLSATFGLDFGAGDVHGEFTYATGDDDGLSDMEFDNFLNPAGASYYWSEIMGYGMFDNQASAGSPADQISNIWFLNVGAGFKPMDRLKLTADLWYAELAEDNAAGETELGTEIDLKASYMLVDGLTLDMVGAYLFAGDATGTEDPYEVGAQLSLSF